MEEITFTPNPRLEKELHKFTDVAVGVRSAADAIAARAREMAPAQSGAYREGIIVNQPNGKGVARVVATDQKSAWIEFGTSSQPPVFNLRQAVQSLGLEFKKSSS